MKSLIASDLEGKNFKENVLLIQVETEEVVAIHGTPTQIGVGQDQMGTCYCSALLPHLRTNTNMPTHAFVSMQCVTTSCF